MLDDKLMEALYLSLFGGFLTVSMILASRLAAKCGKDDISEHTHRKYSVTPQEALQKKIRETVGKE